MRFGESPSQTDSPIDASKRYDIYCHEAAQKFVVYRNARFLTNRRLFSSENKFDLMAEYYELELANGKSIFVRRHNVVKFCEPGVDASGEQT